MARVHSSAMPVAARPSDRPKVFEENRVCRHVTCKTKLSRYNSDVYCYVHAASL